jgi:hypothetical protein
MGNGDVVKSWHDLSYSHVPWFQYIPMSHGFTTLPCPTIYLIPMSHDFTTFRCLMIYLFAMSHDFSTFPCPMILLHPHFPWFYYRETGK